MARCILVRHGEAFGASEDPQRRLTPQGKEGIKRLGKQLALLKLASTLTHLYTSTKARAQETGEILSAYLPKHPRVQILKFLEPSEDPDTLKDFLLELQETAILVGHLPNIAIVMEALLVPLPFLTFSPGSAAILSLDPEKPSSNQLLAFYSPTL